MGFQLPTSTGERHQVDPEILQRSWTSNEMPWKKTIPNRKNIGKHMEKQQTQLVFVDHEAIIGYNLGVCGRVLTESWSRFNFFDYQKQIPEVLRLARNWNGPQRCQWVNMGQHGPSLQTCVVMWPNNHLSRVCAFWELKVGFHSIQQLPPAYIILPPTFAASWVVASWQELKYARVLVSALDAWETVLRTWL